MIDNANFSLNEGIRSLNRQRGIQDVVWETGQALSIRFPLALSLLLPFLFLNCRIQGRIMAAGNRSWLTFGSTSQACSQTVFKYRLPQNNPLSRRLLVDAAKSSPLSGARQPRILVDVRPRMFAESRMMALSSKYHMGKQMICFKPPKLGADR